MAILLPTTDADCTQPPCRGLSSHRHFTRKHKNLNEVPHDIPADSLQVDLDENAITSLPAGVFSHLTQCTLLSLRHNKISSIEDQAFRGLGSLVELKLSVNKISVLQANMFTGLVNLTTLMLNLNNISLVDENAFRGLESLQQLSLFDNRISQVQPQMFLGLDNLMQLSLTNNQISKIHSGVFAKLNSLRELRLCCNMISILQSGMFSGLGDLMVVYLDRNEISVLNAGIFAGLKILNKLDLSKNKITHVGEGTFDTLYSIKRIYLDGNQLTTLMPEAFLNLPRNPLGLALSDPLEVNQWDCSSLCWLKYEEQHETIKWLLGKQPKCANGRDWNSIQCDNPGVFGLHISVHSMRCLPDLEHERLPSLLWSDTKTNPHCY